MYIEGSEHGLQCNQWDCRFTTKGSKYIPSELKILTEHINTKHGFKCNHCDDGFESKVKLNDHISNEHPDSEDDTDDE